jgi:hypothetical protein
MKKNFIIFLITAIALFGQLFFSARICAQNVGINIETPQARLHIYKGSSGYVGVYPHQDLIIESNDHTWINLLAPNDKEMGLLFGKPSNIASGGIVYDIYNNMHFRTNGNVTRMFLGQNGDVGIGRIPGSFKLEIGGTQPGIGFYSGTNYAGFVFAIDNALQVGGKNGISGTSAANDLILQPPSSFPFFSGNVGVSTNTPTAKLQVNGNTMIGSGNPAAGYTLSVNGKIICTEAKVQLKSSWPDYVFQNNYSLMPLQELEQFIKKEKHLPEIPSAKEIELKGLELGDMVKRLVEKVEELTLYVIQLKKENVQLTKEIDQLQRK